MRARLRIVSVYIFLLPLAGAWPALAQSPQPNPYNGDEPANFTHWVDTNGDGQCDTLLQPDSQGVYPNGLYPTCDIPGGGTQVAHAHWEYIHNQVDARTGETEEKDYLDTTQAPEAMLDQTARFGANEPVRFYRALSPSENPSGHYWQVDQWIGPKDVPFLTWTERFFECSGPESCASVDGQMVSGGYWSTDAQPLYDAFSQPVVCGDGLEASPSTPRSPCCGMVFTLP